jgi:hypothetical protein
MKTIAGWAICMAGALVAGSLVAGDVHLDGAAGDDAADGQTPATAVRTFERAKELRGGAGDILVCGKISVDDINIGISDKRPSLYLPTRLLVR